MMPLWATSALLLQLLGQVAATSKVLVIGDSMGDYSCGNPNGLGGQSFLSDFCTGATVTNVAVSGSSAFQWAAGGPHAAKTVAGLQTAGGGVSHIWISLGGNDYMAPAENGAAAASAPGSAAAGCAITQADLVTRITGALTATVTAVENSGVATAATKIVLIGYCQPATPQCPGNSHDMSRLATALQQVASSMGDQVEYHNISARCGGVPNSDMSFFVPDGLHLNRKGYCAAFSMPAVQTAFGCSSATYDCESAFGTCSGESGGGRAIEGGAPGSPEQAYTFPVKSANLENAMAVQWYKVNGDLSSSLGTVTDLHAVHGVQTPGGGYVMCGKGLESEVQGAKTESFCVKYDSTGGTSWGWKSNTPGKSDAANAVVPISSTHVVVVGWRTDASGTDGRRYITKLSSTTGAEVWTATAFADAPGTTSFYEMIEISDDAVYLSGGINKLNTDEMSFKSYGNVAGGQATVQALPLDALLASSPPTSADIVWTRTYPAYLAAKAARPVGAASNQVATLLYGEVTNKHSSVVMLNATDGSEVWAPRNFDEQGEGTDLQVSKDKNSFVIAGQGHPSSSPGTLYGQLTKVDKDGNRLWTKKFSSCGAVGTNACNKKLIFNECWGAVTLPDGGYAMSCGTGIEGCDPAIFSPALSASDMADCLSGDGDKRPGAYKRGASVWQSMLVRTNADGELQWQRVDSYRPPGSPALGASSWVPASSAAEWVVKTADGGLAVITDEGSGTGLLKLGGSETAATSNPGGADLGDGPGTGSGAGGSPTGAGNTTEVWQWVASARLCLGWVANCKNAAECTKVAYGPCLGTAVTPEVYLKSTFAGLIYVNEANYLGCGTSGTCAHMKVIPANPSHGVGYRDTSLDADGPQENSTYAYTMAGNIYGDLNTVGMYTGISSYLNTGMIDISTADNNLFMATPDATARVNRVADDGSPIGAPIGPFEACIADVIGGECVGERVFRPSEYKFSLFGTAAGEAYDAAVVAGQNGFPAGMDHVGVRVKLETVGFTSIMVNGRDYDATRTGEAVSLLEFSGEEGSMSVAFPSTYNIGSMQGMRVQMHEAKTVKIKVHSLDVQTASLFIDYLFESPTITGGKVFVYDPTVTVPTPTPVVDADTDAEADPTPSPVPVVPSASPSTLVTSPAHMASGMVVCALAALFTCTM